MLKSLSNSFLVAVHALFAPLKLAAVRQIPDLSASSQSGAGSDDPPPVTGEPSHLRAVFGALLVTFLWSTSWVLIKIGLQDIPALPFAGLRYMLAFVCLLPFALCSRQLAPRRRLSLGTWARLITLGLLFYAVTQGAQFLSLFYLPALTTSLLLSFTAVIVALLGIFLLGERPTVLQWGGSGLYLIGVGIYFYPLSLPGTEMIGLIAAGLGVLANALSSILGRHVNRARDLEPMLVTVVSMGSGAVVLLVVGIIVQGWPRLTLTNWALIIWLAVVNSAFAFTLWNRTLRTLSAMESSIINNTMLFQIAILAWVFLGERLAWREVAGMVLAGLGTLVVQICRPQE
jgi:drug/metabolite transporter (DMT)-like permease